MFTISNKIHSDEENMLLNGSFERESHASGLPRNESAHHSPPKSVQFPTDKHNYQLVQNQNIPPYEYLPTNKPLGPPQILHQPPPQFFYPLHNSNSNPISSVKQNMNYIQQPPLYPLFPNTLYPNPINSTFSPPSHTINPMQQVFLHNQSPNKQIPPQHIQPPYIFPPTSYFPQENNFLYLPRESSPYGYNMPLHISPSIVYPHSAINNYPNINPISPNYPYSQINPIQSEPPQNLIGQQSISKGNITAYSSNQTYKPNQTIYQNNENQNTIVLNASKSTFENQQATPVKQNKIFDSSQIRGQYTTRFDNDYVLKPNSKQNKFSAEKPLQDNFKGDTEFKNSSHQFSPLSQHIHSKGMQTNLVSTKSTQTSSKNRESLKSTKERNSQLSNIQNISENIEPKNIPLSTPVDSMLSKDTSLSKKTASLLLPGQVKVLPLQNNSLNKQSINLNDSNSNLAESTKFINSEKILTFKNIPKNNTDINLISTRESTLKKHKIQNCLPKGSLQSQNTPITKISSSPSENINFLTFVTQLEIDDSDNAITPLDSPQISSNVKNPKKTLESESLGSASLDPSLQYFSSTLQKKGNKSCKDQEPLSNVSEKILSILDLSTQPLNSQLKHKIDTFEKVTPDSVENIPQVQEDNSTKFLSINNDTSSILEINSTKSSKSIIQGKNTNTIIFHDSIPVIQNTYLSQNNLSQEESASLPSLNSNINNSNFQDSTNNIENNSDFIVEQENKIPINQNILHKSEETENFFNTSIEKTNSTENLFQPLPSEYIKPPEYELSINQNSQLISSSKNQNLSLKELNDNDNIKPVDTNVFNSTESTVNIEKDYKTETKLIKEDSPNIIVQSHEILSKDNFKSLDKKDLESYSSKDKENATLLITNLSSEILYTTDSSLNAQSHLPDFNNGLKEVTIEKNLLHCAETKDLHNEFSKDVHSITNSQVSFSDIKSSISPLSKPSSSLQIPSLLNPLQTPNESFIFTSKIDNKLQQNEVFIKSEQTTSSSITMSTDQFLSEERIIEPLKQNSDSENNKVSIKKQSTNLNKFELIFIYNKLKSNGHFDSITPFYSLKGNQQVEMTKKTTNPQLSKSERQIASKFTHNNVNSSNNINNSSTSTNSTSGTAFSVWRSTSFTKDVKPQSILSPPQQLKNFTRSYKYQESSNNQNISHITEKPSLFGKGKKSVTLIDLLKKEITGLLNKLTIEKFATITEQIALKCDQIETIKELEMFVDIVLNKAITQPTYCDMYADLCIVLRWRSKSNTKLPKEAKDFAYLMACRIEDDFSTFPSISFNATKEELTNLSDIDREAAVTMRKIKVLGTIQLLGRLITRKLVKYDIIEQEIERVLLLPDTITKKLPDEHLIECALEFYTSIGYYTYKNYTHEGLANIHKWAKCFKGHQESGYYSKRINFKIQDFLDLLENNWTRKTFREKAKTVAQIHEDAVADEKLGGAIISAQQGNYELIGLYDNQPYLTYLSQQHQLYKNNHLSNDNITQKIEYSNTQPPPPPPPIESFPNDLGNSLQNRKTDFQSSNPSSYSVYTGSKLKAPLSQNTSMLGSNDTSLSNFSFQANKSPHRISSLNNNSFTHFNLQSSSNSSDISNNSSVSNLLSRDIAFQNSNYFSQTNNSNTIQAYAPVKLTQLNFLNDVKHKQKIISSDENFLTTSERNLHSDDLLTKDIESCERFLSTNALNEKVLKVLKACLTNDDKTWYFLIFWKESIKPNDTNNQFLLLCKAAHKIVLDMINSPPKISKLLEITSDLAKSISNTTDNENVFKLTDVVLNLFRNKMLENTTIMNFFGELCGCLLIHKLDHLSDYSLSSFKNCPNEDTALDIILSIYNGIMKRNFELSSDFLQIQKHSLLNIFPNLTERTLNNKIKEKSLI